MNLVIYLIGVVVLVALIVRGAVAFYDDWKKRNPRQ